MKHIWITLTLLLISSALQAGVQGQLRQGGKLYNQEKYGSALNVYNQILHKQPTHQPALFNAGNAYYRLHEYTQAEQTYKQAAEQPGDYSQHALYNLGNTYYKAGNTDKAIESYKKAILANPQDKEAIHNLQLLIQEKQNNQNKNNQNKDNQDNSSDNKSEQNQSNAGSQPQPQNNNAQPNPTMNKQDADRIMAMAKEQEYKPGNGSRQSAESTVEKDW